MRNTLFLFFFCITILYSCNSSSGEFATDERVRIELTEKSSVQQTGSITVSVNLAKPRTFSVGFWKYFRQQFPRAFALIFQSPKVSERHIGSPVKHVESSVTLDEGMIAALQQLLPAKEFQEEGSGDTSRFAGKKINTKYYIIRDYALLKTILNDSAYTPTVIFSKDFVPGTGH